MARRLLARQDGLSRLEHQAAFEVALEAWPLRRGANSLAETQVSWAGMLKATGGYSDEDIAGILGVKLETLRRRGILSRAETWRTEVVGRPVDPMPEQTFGTARFPRVVRGWHPKTVLEIGHEQCLWMPAVVVNLPFGYRRQAHETRRARDPQAAEDAFLRRFIELRRSRVAA